MSLDFVYDNEYHVHIGRARKIRTSHPEVRALMGTNPATALWTLALVLLQWGVAYGMTQVSWVWVFVAAYLFGAFVNHALYALMHECAHNLVFRNPAYNKLLGIFGDLALFVPGAIGFRKYHLMHHQYLGLYDKDADIVSRTEARLIGNSTLRKALWVFLLGLSQALRPLRLKGVNFIDRWFVANVMAVIAIDILLLAVLGPKALAYIGLSTLFALGLHPVGGRWIQEHYTDGDGQETHSYYGPLNRLSFNIGYHTEHHDFASIPWNKLPKLKSLAPEYYDNLKSYRSWSSVLMRFISDRSMSTFNRILHEPHERAAPKTDARPSQDH
ncbi:MAG: fatty acid desaturase [Hoeflea sp.]|uniref:fatty acid desaturase n=1 Tax=Hoeflea sp. TaxID=1940281 RepID=UPI0032EC17AF